MKFGRWTGRIAVAVGITLLPVGAQLNAWAVERTSLVRSGSPAEATAGFVMAGEGESLLAPGSDPALRVTVDGDLASASHIAVLVPGVDTTANQFDLPPEIAGAKGTAMDWWRTMPGWARSLRQAAAEAVPGGLEDVAVVAWLGYQTPVGVAGASLSAMKQGSANLVAFDQFLKMERPDADITWVCHSYGSLVCASALVETDPDALVLLGSPGVGVGEASDLATPAPVWAGETGQDLIGLTRLMGVFGGSFGVLPSSDRFGALPLPCDPEDGHSGYFRPGSAQVRSMAAIVMGTPDPLAGGGVSI
ncbi:MAG: alpha/beta hydrolase family protein [Bifidobacteriaceae bacterium]|nr:alpha/beta hydrolase family protein [Bifidobacteriaceae bacterium]